MGVEFGGLAFHVTNLNATQWVLCIILGVISLPLQQIINCSYVFILKLLDIRSGKRYKKNEEMIHRNVVPSSGRSLGADSVESSWGVSQSISYDNSRVCNSGACPK